MKPIIKIENLSKRYRIGALQMPYQTLRETLTQKVRAPFELFRKNGNTDNPSVWALKDVSFEVKPGEVVGIIGRNGAGKSTLLKVLSRITEPTKGRVVLYGRVGSLLEVGTGFHPELTGRENIFLNATVLGMRRGEIRSKFDEIVAFAEVEKFIDTPVKRYSSGMYLRLAFAVAAHLEPEILVVDEVLAVGDVAFQKKCIGKMEGVAKEGRTVLFVSHNMPALARLCSKSILLESGCLIKHGLTTDVIAAYMDALTESGASRQWSLESAPGSIEVKLLSVDLLRDDGNAAAVVSVGDQLHLRIRYFIGIPGIKFRCAAIFSTQGIIAFGSLEQLEHERTHVGIYSSVVTIPSNLLGEDEYTVTVSMFSSRGVKSHYVYAKDVIAFQVTDPMTEKSARGDYAEKFAGVVRPLLNWQLMFEREDHEI